MKKIVLIANSNQVTNINNIISPEDIIVRFNVPKNDTYKLTGYRTDFLFLANTVDLMESRLKKIRFHKLISSLKNTTIFFSYEDDLINKINPVCTLKKNFIFFKYEVKIKNSDNQKYIKYFLSKNLKVQILDQSYYWSAKKAVNQDSFDHSDSSDIISTGLLALYYFLENPDYSDYQIYLCGFTFQGWKRHDWNNEKEFILNLFKQNKVCLI